MLALHLIFIKLGLGIIYCLIKMLMNLNQEHAPTLGDGGGGNLPACLRLLPMDFEHEHSSSNKNM